MNEGFLILRVFLESSRVINTRGFQFTGAYIDVSEVSLLYEFMKEHV